MPDGIARRWTRFLGQRFPPALLLPLIGVFLAAHVQRAGQGVPSPAVLGLGLALGALFLRMRLMDELKDFETDLLLHPERPLPSGLVSRREVVGALRLCLGIELLGSLCLGLPALAGVLLVQAFTFLMYREFFLGQVLRARLTTYAVLHTFVVVLQSLWLSGALRGRFLWEADTAAVRFAGAGWGFFNLYEFGRKTWAGTEERADAPSYSKVFGRSGAVLLSVSQVLLGILLWPGPGASGRLLAPGIVALLLLLIAGGHYLVRDDAASAGRFRLASGLSIFLFYLGAALPL